ncbi:glycerate kinase [Rhodoferax sp.]|uniref:glycerate kinase n=1 Tax=Rhodoferax sp. TaxID=50421 RepID=UPI00260B6B8C|nr:glycerate kinase [Rhodoferax sp.]MDD2925178.1 glycerate kinase [Rhodoferax sp.]
MQWQKILIPLACVALVLTGYQSYGWAGVAAATGALMMWLLLHFGRMMQVLKRAAQRPIGYVDSAVMLHARLRPGLTLMHVVAMTRSLGEPQSPRDSQPELFRWTDASKSYVTAEFHGGKLRTWELVRPAPAPV